MAGYIGRSKSGVNVAGYTNSQIDTLIEAAGGVEVSGTEPSSPSEGDLWYDSTVGVKVLKYYNGTGWFKVSSLIPTLTSISGTIFEGTATSLTLSGTNFLESNLIVNFTQASDSIDVDVTVTPTSSTSATVAVPSSVYDSVTSGNVVTIKVTNSDDVESNTLTKTAITLPTGGTITTSGGYRYHEFTSSGDFVVSNEITGVDYIVVAAGGGGGGWGGGGGAGGLINQTSQTLSAATYPIVLGAGGYGTGVAAGYQGTYQGGSDGGDTTFNSLTAIGGGGGGYFSANPGRAGGSGGGGGGSNGTLNDTAGGSGTAGQGNAGGYGGGVSANYGGGGGGGGAGAAGSNATGYGATGGAGGAGLAPTGFSSFGDSGYFAGGAGGHTDRQAGAGVSAGGVGGGGNGGGYVPNTNAENGDANTGGGGGGSYGASSNGKCGHGGSGTVIIRYAL